MSAHRRRARVQVSQALLFAGAWPQEFREMMITGVCLTSDGLVEFHVEHRGLPRIPLGARPPLVSPVLTGCERGTHLVRWGVPGEG